MVDLSAHVDANGTSWSPGGILGGSEGIEIGEMSHGRACGNHLGRFCVLESHCGIMMEDWLR